MTETLRAYVERMARLTTLEDEFAADTALQDRYDDADDYRADLDDERLCSEFETLEEMIKDAREVLAQPDPLPIMRDALALALERVEMNNYGGEEDASIAEIKAALALAGGDTVAAPAAPDYPAILRDIAGQMTVEAMLRIIGGPAAGSGDTTAGTDAMRLALESAEHWLTEEAANPGQTTPDEILRVIRAALGKG